MDSQTMEEQGTGLSDILRILSHVPQERLSSLIFQFQLCKRPEEALVHTLCLVLLRRDADKVQERLLTLKSSDLGNYLAHKWHVSGGELDTFRVECASHSEEEPTDHRMMIELARVFKVLCSEGLCNPLLRDLAYQRALSASDQNAWDRQHLKYSYLDQLREEAKLVCGPDFAAWMCSSSNEVSGLLDKDNNSQSLKPTSEDPSDLPSPLQDSYSTDSYPTHLEISLPSTATFDRTISTALVCEPQPSNATHVAEKDILDGAAAGRMAFSTESLCESHQTPPVKGEAYVNNTNMAPGSASLSAKGNKPQGDTAPNRDPKTTVPTFEPKSAPAITFTPEIKVPTQSYDVKQSSGEEEEEEEEEEEDKFYSFVILHAPQDTEMAESTRERLEALANIEGATFTEDFACPGKATFRCIEDAIDNSAYTVLLLTRNFGARLQEVEMNTALVNSINHRHKYNTVIPLHPRENCMPRERQPKVLQTLIPLEERSRNFERKVKMVLSPAKVKGQKRKWDEEQKVKRQARRQERLRHANEQQKRHNKELKKTKLLEQEQMRLRLERLDIERSPHQHYYPQNTVPRFTNVPSGFVPPPQVGEDGRQWSGSIHIENANYIMIGNDSQMTVDLGGAAASREDSVDDDDELYCPL